MTEPASETVSLTTEADPWQEPVRGVFPPEAILALDGMSRQACILEASLLPPIHHLLGVLPTDLSHGAGAARLPATEWLVSADGNIPLGVLCLIADMAFGLAYESTLAPGSAYVTAELTLHRLGAPARDGDLTACGKLVHADPAIALTRADVRDSRGQLVASGLSRIAGLRPFPAHRLPPMPATWKRTDEPQSTTPDPWRRPATGEVIPREVWADRSGRDVLSALVQGKLPLPPLSRLTGLRWTTVDDAGVTAVLPASGWLATPARTVQGGWMAVVADAALQASIRATAEAGVDLSPLDIKVNYLKPVMPDGRLLTSRGSVVHRGRSIIVANADVVDADGRRVALATGSAIAVDRAR